MTLEEMALKLGVDQTTAYGFVRFLEAKRLVTTVGSKKKDPGSRGKGKKLYAIKAEAAKELSDLISSFAALPE